MTKSAEKIAISHADVAGKCLAFPSGSNRQMKSHRLRSVSRYEQQLIDACVNHEINGKYAEVKYIFTFTKPLT